MPTTGRTKTGNGPGWGGPAKGAGRGAARHPNFGPGNKFAVGRSAPRVDEQAQALRDHLYNLATSAERQETQVRAAEAWLNRIEGMPVARNVTHSTDDIATLDDNALAQRRAELERALGARDAGDAPPPRSH